jgi:FtsP/CotA-like multicopper oxidase with cupredoxin domain
MLRGEGRLLFVSILAGLLVGTGAGYLLPGESFGKAPDTESSMTIPFDPRVTRPEPEPDGVREYVLSAVDVEHKVTLGVTVPAWSLNGTVPGPTITAIEGELVRIKFLNNSPRPQTLHFHGIHNPEYDGVHEIVMPNESYVYELEASPPGLYLYHSHVLPISRQVNRGFFGAYLIYPKDADILPAAKELIFIQHFIDTDGESEQAEFYALNGQADQYINLPIELKVGELARVYLINMNIEFATFHIHANVFQAYQGLGMNRDQIVSGDTVGLGWGERAVLEFFYTKPGLFLFHDHISEHSDLGLRGWFKVTS